MDDWPAQANAPVF